MAAFSRVGGALLEKEQKKSKDVMALVRPLEVEMEQGS